MLVHKDRGQLELFIAGSLQQLVPEDHVLARAADQMQIEIKLALDMVVGGAWETGGYPGAVERQGEFGGLIGETLQGGGPRC